MSAPTPQERIVALSLAGGSMGTALGLLSDARVVVVPSGDRCVLDRRTNYDYQTALADAVRALERADKIIQDQIEELVPRRCDWPGKHIAMKHVPGTDSISRCEACGEEIGK